MPIITINLNDEAELRELQAAAKRRMAELTKLQKKCEDEFAPTEAAGFFSRLSLWLGRDGEPGIIERIAEQVSIFEVHYKEPQFSPQVDAFEARAEPAGDQEAQSAEDDEYVDADYEIVDAIEPAPAVRLLAAGD